MSATVKQLQKGAFQLEAGLAGAGQSPGWGASGSEETLGSGDAFSFLDFQKGATLTHAEDNSIVGSAFNTLPRLVTRHVEKNISMLLDYENMGKFYYWLFGFELVPDLVVVGVFSTPTVEPTAGATYRDASNNDFTFIRKEVKSYATHHVFKAVDSVTFSETAGNLTKQTGTGDATLTYSAHSAVLAEHLFELDMNERHMTAYRTAEQIGAYAEGDLKNRMATLGIKTAVSDYRYKNAMCKKFGFKSSAGGFITLDTDFLAYNEEAGDYSSTNWTFPTLIDTYNKIIHSDLKIEIGESESTLSAIYCSDVDFNVEIPLRVIQDTVSGLYICEPLLEGKYVIDFNTILSRHSSNTMLTARDAQTPYIAKCAAYSSYNKLEVLFNNLIIKEAGPNEDDVAKEPLNFASGYTTTNNWATWLSGRTLIQNSPIILVSRCPIATHWMFSI